MKLSECCGSEVQDHLSMAYPDREDFELIGKTNWFVCRGCGKPCDVEDKGNNIYGAGSPEAEGGTLGFGRINN